MTATVVTYVTEGMETTEKMLATGRRKQIYGRRQQQQPETSEIPATAQTRKNSREQTTAKMPENAGTLGMLRQQVHQYDSKSKTALAMRSQAITGTLAKRSNLQQNTLKTSLHFQQCLRTLKGQFFQKKILWDIRNCSRRENVHFLSCL
jgi:hypothetical protein